MDFIVEREGQKVKNPQTNMYITLPGQAVGEIKVEQCVGDTVENEVSFCSVTKGDFSNYIKNKDGQTFSKNPDCDKDHSRKSLKIITKF